MVKNQPTIEIIPIDWDEHEKNVIQRNAKKDERQASTSKCVCGADTPCIDKMKCPLFIVIV